MAEDWELLRFPRGRGQLWERFHSAIQVLAAQDGAGLSRSREAAVPAQTQEAQRRARRVVLRTLALFDWDSSCRTAREPLDTLRSYQDVWDTISDPLRRLLEAVGQPDAAALVAQLHTAIHALTGEE